MPHAVRFAVPEAPTGRDRLMLYLVGQLGELVLLALPILVCRRGQQPADRAVICYRMLPNFLNVGSCS